MSDSMQERWQEWLGQAETQALLTAFKRQSNLLKSRWADSLFHRPVDPQSGEYPDLRAKSQVFDDLSQLNLSMIEELMNYE